MAILHDVEEVFALWYMLRCLGVNFDTASEVYGDNLGFNQNATIKYFFIKEESFHN